MESELLLKRLDTPIKRKVRRILEEIEKNKYFEISREIYDKIVEKLGHEDWSIRARALGALTSIALRDKNYLEDTLNNLSKGLEDENPNVKVKAIQSYRALLEKYKDEVGGIIGEVINRGLLDENGDVKSSTLQLLIDASSLGVVDVKNYINQVLEFSKTTENPKILENCVKIFLENYKDLPEDVKEELKDLTFTMLRSKEFEIRKIGLILLNKLYSEGGIEEKDFREVLIKRIRDEKDVVTQYSIEILDSIAKKEPEKLDHYIGIVFGEVWSRKKNKKLKIRILEFLKENLENIPRDMLNKHNIPRILDKIEKGAVPKNWYYQKIKELSRNILESLGFTLEKRMKVFSKK